MAGPFLPHVMGGGFYQNPPRNSLVEESSVPDLRVPSQMLSGLLLSLIPRFVRDSHVGKEEYRRNNDQPRTCESCGTSHRDIYQCPAANRKCYSCRRYGHYAQFCDTKMTGKPDNGPPTLKTPSDTAQISSVSESIITDQDEKVKNLKTQIQELEQSSTKLLNENVKLKKECADLKVRNNELLDKSNKVQCHNVSLIEECADLQDHNKELAEQFKPVKQSLGEAEQKTILQEAQLRKLLEYTVKLDGCCTDYQHLTEHLMDEYCQLQFAYQPPDSNRSLCKRCGTASHTTRATCPANDAFCCRCGKIDHFAAVCESEILPTAEPDDETELLINNLETTTGIKFGKTINCVRCDADSDDESEDDSDDDAVPNIAKVARPENGYPCSRCGKVNYIADVCLRCQWNDENPESDDDYSDCIFGHQS